MTNIEAVEIPVGDREFRAMPKIPRLYRDIVVTEKIDGTNASIHIDSYRRVGTFDDAFGNIRAAGRTRWLAPGKQTDNFGFAAWVEANRDVLLTLGPGSHFGEWWGAGIQRRYDLTEKRFSLFNAGRWTGNVSPVLQSIGVGVVPILYQGIFNTDEIEAVKDKLRNQGSVAAPGFMKPEGVVVFHKASGTIFKSLLENDQIHKGEENV